MTAAATRERRRAELGTIGPAQMDPADALWILDYVLRWANGWPVTPCWCLLGTCGACATGQHQRCLNTQRPPAWHGSPEGWITDRRGFVLNATVWLADRTCRYRCPCACPPSPSPATRPVPAPRPEQLDLFAEAC
jgi:hypothetical protein